MPPSLIARARDELGVAASRVYGSSECPTATGTPPDASEDRQTDTDGRAIGAARLRVVDPAGAVLGAGEVGEVQLRGPELFVGYLDPALGERACAFVVASEPLQLADLVAFLRECRIATQKLPERLVLVDELPTTASGKVQKFRLRERLAG